MGSRLTAKLVSQGHKVRVLTRDVGAARSKLQTAVVAGAGQLEYFPPAQWRDALAGATGVVNLAGEPIANRWTPEVKRLIKASRVGTTQALVEALAALPAGSRPAALVSASAVGFYGTSGSATFNEDSASGADYLAEVCR